MLRDGRTDGRTNRQTDRLAPTHEELPPTPRFSPYFSSPPTSPPSVPLHPVVRLRTGTARGVGVDVVVGVGVMPGASHHRRRQRVSRASVLVSPGQWQAGSRRESRFTSGKGWVEQHRVAATRTAAAGFYVWFARIRRVRSDRAGEALSGRREREEEKWSAQPDRSRYERTADYSWVNRERVRVRPYAVFVLVSVGAIVRRRHELATGTALSRTVPRSSPVSLRDSASRRRDRGRDRELCVRWKCSSRD